jgi:alkylation response protein AidB-like acyl-CoA dehydrogenase
VSPAVIRAADTLEVMLGDPEDVAGAFTFAACAALDRDEEFPTGILKHLDGLGLPEFYVPAGLGGRLAAFPDLFDVIRTLARRDFTVALAHCKTYLGSACVWMGAAPEQAARLAGRVLDGAVVSLALTERGHGSDLLAGDVTAVRTPDGYVLDGAKWLINNAGRADVMCVLARTDATAGARGLSLFLVDIRALPPDAYRRLPKVPTLGVRGADISGIAFSGAVIGADCLVGEEGGGLELVLRSLQVTRTLCAAMSVGLADHALRITIGFAREHRLYGRALLDLPLAARTLAEAGTDLLLAQAVGLVGSRAIHSLPAEQSIISALVKYVVPSRTDATISRLAGVLGARSLLTEAYADGHFQKVERDHRIVGIFDGSTVVNLNAVINQFPALVRAWRTGRVDEPGVDQATDLCTTLPEFAAERLSLVSRAGCSPVQALPAMVRQVGGLVDAGAAPAVLGELSSRLGVLTDRLHTAMAAHRPSRDVPTGAFAVAARYATVFAGACALGLWLANRSTVGTATPLGGTGWIVAALHRVLAQLELTVVAADGACDTAYDEVLAAVLAQDGQGRPYSLVRSMTEGEAG